MTCQNLAVQAEPPVSRGAFSAGPVHPCPSQQAPTLSLESRATRAPVQFRAITPSQLHIRPLTGQPRVRHGSTQTTAEADRAEANNPPTDKTNGTHEHH